MAALTMDFVWTPSTRPPENKKPSVKASTRAKESAENRATAKAIAKERARANAKAKLNHKRRSYKSSNVVMDPRIVERFNRGVECLRLGIPVDYGFPSRGSIRFLESDASFGLIVRAHDRTLQEWLALIKVMKTKAVSNSDKNHAIAFERFFYTNRRLRWLVYKWIGKVRRRIMDKRVIGEEDMVTLLPIPIDSLVSVYDIKGRNKYQFHTNTMVRTIVSSLAYGTYGVATPQEPKNPYTNISWTYGQILSIVGQLLRNQALHHRATSVIIVTYRSSNYDIQEFFKKNGVFLKLSAAKAFFAAKEDPSTIEIYNEVLDDLYDDEELPKSWSLVARLVKARHLSDDLMKEWDSVVLSFWLYTNNIIVMSPFVSYEDIIDQFHALNTTSLHWWRTQPRRIIRRPV
jgi:hypothetical protein